MNKTKPPKEDLLLQISRFNGIHEVANYYNVSFGTIRCWMRWHEINLCPSREILYEDCLNLTDKEIARKYKVTDKSITLWKKNYKISKLEIKKQKFPTELTNEQENIINGILLGDAWLSDPKSGRNKNSYLGLEHCTEQYQYVEHLNKKLHPYSYKIYEKTRINPFKTKKTHKDKIESCGFHTAQLELFTKLRLKWYPNNKKIVPKDLDLSWQTLAYWFCDDGSNLLGERCIRRHGILCTNSFELNDVEFLIKKIKEKNIDCKYYLNYNKPLIILNKSTFMNFLNNINHFIDCECMRYKFKTNVEKMKGI